ncbi:hypothetical protein DH2020_042617 [Rehmannia glutinosa]|uniref:beta-galactosidase n=1 Tax=Rehmannia glutinosa TaxID=99300 RepID=A0ABR0UME6_REHGL
MASALKFSGLKHLELVTLTDLQKMLLAFFRLHYHGGTNFGRTSGGPFITTSYDYDAPIDEYGLARCPKWGHLKELHRSIKLCEHPLLNGEPINLSLGPSQEADVYEESSGACAAFISNMDDKNNKTVVFRNTSYYLPAWSVSILPDCKNVVFNTAKVTSQTSMVEMIPTDLQPSATSPNKDLRGLQWDVFTEKAGIWGAADFTKSGLVLFHDSLLVDETEEFLRSGRSPMLVVESKGHAMHVFINQKLQGSASGNGTVSPFKLKTPISLKAGVNEIVLLSMTVGLQHTRPLRLERLFNMYTRRPLNPYFRGVLIDYLRNSRRFLVKLLREALKMLGIENAGAFYEWVGAGPTSVRIVGMKNSTVDLSTSTWTYKAFKISRGNNVLKTLGEIGCGGLSTWTRPVGLDMIHMGKGLAWLNGNEIGRYWSRKASKHEKCVQQCDYRGKFMPNKCNTGCGEPTQRWYHVPRSWFKPSGNILVIFEEKGGDPNEIRFSTRKVSSVCVHVSENHPSFDFAYSQKSAIGDYKNKATVKLKCPMSSQISAVKFASFGDPVGSCGSYALGKCHDRNSISMVEQVCLNQNDCELELSEENFDMHLCPNLVKKLAVEVVCS